MTAPDVTVRTVVVEEHDGDWLAMDEAGDITAHGSPESVVKAVRKVDARAARRGQSTVTRIEWRGMPEGFTPPEVTA